MSNNINIQDAMTFFMDHRNSNAQEKFAEYFFLKDLILTAALKGHKLNIARSDFDAFGYDIIISNEINKILYIQLKAKSGGSTKKWDVHKSLLRNQNGRVVLIELKIDSTKNLAPKYLMFKKTETDTALSNPGKKENRCKVLRSQFEDITEDLLKIFK